jgi:hypothetical protein
MTILYVCNSKSYGNLLKALDIVKEIAKFVNETERSWSKVKAIQDSIQGNFKVLYCHHFAIFTLFIGIFRRRAAVC